MAEAATVVCSDTGKGVSKGSWTVEEDHKLAEVVAVHGARKWTMLAAKAGLNRSGKSCRLRWLNYLRPNIKRGNISAQEEDLIVRLHKLLGNRWSLIAGRLPGRTDNEIKNYWNSHLSKRLKHTNGVSCLDSVLSSPRARNKTGINGIEAKITVGVDGPSSNMVSDETLSLEWVCRFLELGDGVLEP